LQNEKPIFAKIAILHSTYWHILFVAAEDGYRHQDEMTSVQNQLTIFMPTASYVPIILKTANL